MAPLAPTREDRQSVDSETRQFQDSVQRQSNHDHDRHCTWSISILLMEDGHATCTHGGLLGAFSSVCASSGPKDLAWTQPERTWHLYSWIRLHSDSCSDWTRPANRCVSRHRTHLWKTLLPWPQPCWQFQPVDVRPDSSKLTAHTHTLVLEWGKWDENATSRCVPSEGRGQWINRWVIAFAEWLKKVLVDFKYVHENRQENPDDAICHHF
jgi:hypothetical protein